MYTLLIFACIRQWDSEKLLERWADDAKTLCAKTGVEMPRDEDVKTQRNALAKVAPGECSVCGDDNDKIATLTCGHGLCAGKWAITIYSNPEKSTQSPTLTTIFTSKFISFH